MPIINNSYHQQFGNALPIQEQLKKGMPILTKPIDKVETAVNDTLDTFVPIEPKDEDTKKSHKTAIRVASTVLVLSALIPFLNPKFSSKLIEKMKTSAAKYGTKGKGKDSFIGKTYQAIETGIYKGAKILNFANNWNSVKDEFFKWICKKTKFLKKPHELITNAFDKISKQTVYIKYADSQKSISGLEDTILHFKSKLPEKEAREVEKLLKTASEQNKYFAKENIATRLKNQEDIMSNLEDSTVRQIKYFGKGVWNRKDKINHIKKNFKFWAEDIIKPKRDKIETDGLNAIQTIIGDGKSKKGTYNEIIDIMIPHLNSNEKTVLEEMFQKAAKKVKKANKTECIEYFDKKRDLMLGSAPTDILSALIGVGLSGIAIGTADTKEDRISRSITVAFPAIAGLGVSMGMTAMLYSGIKGMLIGAASSGILSLTGSTINRAIMPNKNQKEVNNV